MAPACRFGPGFVRRLDVTGHRAGQADEETAMAQYVLAFRSDPNRTASADEEAAWGSWFGELGAAVADFGNRVGRAQMLGGPSGPGGALSGYVVITAEDFDAAVALARGCPGLRSGGQVEVGETVATP
jgi:hypothetical protein